VNKRVEKISPFIVMDIVKEAKGLKDVIHFEVGQPDLPPSKNVKKGLKKVTDELLFPYTESKGESLLREKISEFYKIMYGIAISPHRILITPGTSGAFLIAYALTVDTEEVIAFTDPSYPCYKNFSYFLNITPKFIPVDYRTNYEMRVDALKGVSNVKAIQISSPSNPIGNIYSNETLKELITYCDKKNIYFISDEIYHGLTYSSGEVKSALCFSDNAIVINGFSKYFCMPGIRLGWMILPEHLIREAEILMQNIFISASNISQEIGVYAFDYEHLQNCRDEFKNRRDYLYEELSKIFKIDVVPEGAFYIWVDVSEFTDNSYLFAKELLENIQVAVTPGIDFGENNTNRYLRFAYTRSIEHMREGVSRLKKYLKR
jgi:aspartate/methionine/tyrosine aminotransferase